MTAANLLSIAGGEQQPRVIDEDHLGRMTLGDRSLEREVLEIFVRQTALMLGRIPGAPPAMAAAAAHTLKGSARGIGAWRVAAAAEQLEQAAGAEGGDAAINAAIAELEAAGAEARAAIGARLADGLGARRAAAGDDCSRDH